MSQITYKPVVDGAYTRNGVVIAVDKNSLGLTKLGPKIKLQIHELPTNWRLCEAVADPNALAVPVEDIERILREHDSVYGSRRESNLLVRRVQRWLDALPKATESKTDPE